MLSEGYILYYEFYCVLWKTETQIRVQLLEFILFGYSLSIYHLYTFSRSKNCVLYWDFHFPLVFIYLNILNCI